MESPSTPTNHSTLKGRIQTARFTICTPVALPWTSSPAAFGSNQCQAAIAASIMRKLAASVTQREAWSRNAASGGRGSLPRSTMRAPG